MKKYFILPLLLFSSTCFSQSFREGILNADAIVVGININPSKDKNVDYGREWAPEAIVVRHYIAGSGRDTLPLVEHNGIFRMLAVADVDCDGYWNCYETSVFCLKKYGDSYSVIYDTNAGYAGSSKYKEIEEKVSSMLSIARLADERERFAQTVAWMVSSYINIDGELELAEDSQFVKYYTAKGYISKPINALNDEQVQQLVAYLQAKTDWDDCHRHIKTVKLLRNHLSFEAIEEHIVKYLLGYYNQQYIASWHVRDIAELLDVVNPSLIEPSSVNELESTIDSYKRANIREFAENIHKQWQKSKDKQAENI